MNNPNTGDNNPFTRQGDLPPEGKTRLGARTTKPKPDDDATNGGEDKRRSASGAGVRVFHT